MAVPNSFACENAHRNTIGMDFVLIPAGSFLMGSADADREATSNEKPRHKVVISKSFYIGQYEVTQAQWEAVMGSSPQLLPRSNNFHELPGMAERLWNPANPVTVSWLDAQAFIDRLNRKEGHSRYRLPTEAEWEYAARAGSTAAYSFGDDARQLGRFAWYGEDFDSGATHPVGKKAPNGWCLYDMHGNVWEFCRDWYGSYPEGSVSDPTGPESGEYRVVRGGSWNQPGVSCTATFRGAHETGTSSDIGFRLALVATGE